MPVSDARLNDMMRKVNALMDRADHPNTPPAEAALCRQRAEAIRKKYQLDEEQERQTRLASGTALKPTLETIDLCDYGSQFRTEYWSLAYWLADHIEVRIANDHRKTAEGHYVFTGHVVGFESDIRVFAMLYSGLRNHFGEKVEPTVDPNLSDEDNVYRLRSAGIVRDRIAEMMGWVGDDGDHRAGAMKATALYKKACAARNEDPKVVGKSTNAKTYRECYAEAYVQTIYERLRDMRLSSGESGALLLAGRKAAVDEEFYTRFPGRRPKPMSTEVAEACKKCAKAKSGRCREHSLGPMPKARPFSPLGNQQGTSAAHSADLGGQSGRSLNR